MKYDFSALKDGSIGFSGVFAGNRLEFPQNVDDPISCIHGAGSNAGFWSSS